MNTHFGESETAAYNGVNCNSYMISIAFYLGFGISVVNKRTMRRVPENSTNIIAVDQNLCTLFSQDFYAFQNFELSVQATK